MSIHVLIADDHPLIRSGVRGHLADEPEIEVVAEATNGDEAMQLTNDLHPDILLLDIHMPGMKTVQILSQLQRTNGDTQVIILSAMDDGFTVIGMLRAGAKGYMVKYDDPMLLIEGIRTVTHGNIWVSPSVAGVITESLIKETSNGEPQLLSDRELEVLQLLGRGFTNEQIGRELFISERTVRNDVERIIEALQTHNRTEAVVRAIQQGLIRI